MVTETYPFERYLNVRSASEPSFSPDGTHVSFLTDISGVAEVWAVPLTSPSVYPFWPQQLTFRGERTTRALFSPTADVLLVAGDIGGNERAQLYLLSLDGETFTRLTEKPAVLHLPGGWSPDGQWIVYSSNERDSRFFDVYERNIQSGEVRCLLQQDGTNTALGYSPDGQQVLVDRAETNTSNQLVMVQRATGIERQLTFQEQGEQALYLAPGWSAQRDGLYLLSNQGRDFLALCYLDLATLNLTCVHDAGWDYEQLKVTPDGTIMALVLNENGYSKLALFDISQGWEERWSLPGQDLTAGIIEGLVWSRDGTQLAFSYNAAHDPSDVWIWDRSTASVRRVTQSSRAGLPAAAFTTPTVIEYPTFDERKIPAFLYLPQGKQRDLPVVVHVHGGPEGQARPSFNPVIQYLVHCGYAVLAPNVRGSTGYGNEYQHLDDVHRRLDAVADLKHAALWLHESRTAHVERIAVMGGSYGGFMVLSAITRYPELWAVAIDLVGIANFVTFLESTGPWRRKLRESEYGSLEHDREFLERISPIRQVNRIIAPLFVVHGANDPRVPIREAEQIVAALRERKQAVEYVRFEDEGHGLLKRANKLVVYPAIARFLERYLGTYDE